MASNTSLNLAYSATFKKIGIAFNKQNILFRMSIIGECHMPKIGTTILDEECIRLVKTYIRKLDTASKPMTKQRYNATKPKLGKAEINK